MLEKSDEATPKNSRTAALWTGRKGTSPHGATPELSQNDVGRDHLISLPRQKEIEI